MSRRVVRSRRPVSPAVLLTLIFVLGTGGQARAQTAPGAFSDLGRYLKPGDTVRVVEREQGETQGTVERVSATALALRVGGSERELTPDSVGWIQKIGDPTWDGALYGAAFGGGLALLYASAYDAAPSSGDLGVVAIFTSIFWVLDATKTDDRLVHGTRPRAANWQFRTPRPVASLDELWSRVRPGDTVYVRDSSGRELEGRFTRASRSSLTLAVNGQSRDIAAAEVETVSRRTARLWRGMLLGAAAGTAAGAAFKTEYDGNYAGLGLLVGGALGSIIERLVPQRTTVYGTETQTAISVRPSLGSGRRGVAVSMSF